MEQPKKSLNEWDERNIKSIRELVRRMEYDHERYFGNNHGPLHLGYGGLTKSLVAIYDRKSGQSGR
jgi:hypothetical protein